jgi:hypothetical protein
LMNLGGWDSQSKFWTSEAGRPCLKMVGHWIVDRPKKHETSLLWAVPARRSDLGFHFHGNVAKPMRAVCSSTALLFGASHE